MDIKQLYDENGIAYVPVVHVNAVLDDDGNPIDISGGGGSGNYLRKDAEDTTRYLLNLLGGVKTDNIESLSFSSGSSGWQIGSYHGRSFLEIDDIVARGKFQAQTLDIKKIQYSAGSQVMSFANGTIFYVEGIHANGSVIPINSQTVEDIDHYKIYFRKDLDGTLITNDWAVGDMAHCKDINISKLTIDTVGTSTRIREWFRLVTEVGTTVINNTLCNYICVSNQHSGNKAIQIQLFDDDTHVNAWTFDDTTYNDVPQVGDKVVQEGNVLRLDRLGVMVFDIESQSWDAYKNVGKNTRTVATQYHYKQDNSLSNHPVKISPNNSWINADRIYLGGSSIEYKIGSQHWLLASTGSIRVVKNLSGELDYANPIPNTLSVTAYVLSGNNPIAEDSSVRINAGYETLDGHVTDISSEWGPTVTIDNVSSYCNDPGKFIFYTDYSSIDVPVIYDGNNGNTGDSDYVERQSITYIAWSSGTNRPGSSAGWTAVIPNVPAGKYLWTRVILYFHSGATTEYYSVSRMGMDGGGIVSSVITYSQQEHPINPDTITNWGAFPTTLTEGWWLYTKTHIVYTDGEPTDSYSVSQIGTGSHYAGVEEWYAAGLNILEPPTGYPSQGTYTDGEVIPISANWGQGRPVLNQQNPYLWNFEISRDSAGNKYVTSPVCIGNFVRGIKSIAEYYAISSYSQPSSGRQYPSDITDFDWKSAHYDAVPTEQKPYQWNKSVTTYNDNTVEIGYHITSVRGKNGVDSVSMDLDNQLDTVLTYNGGYAVRNTQITTSYSLYKGSINITQYSIAPTRLSLAINGVLPTIEETGDYTLIQWTIPEGTLFSNHKYSVQILCTYDNVIYTKEFTLTCTDTPTIWQIKPSPRQVSFARNADGELVPNSIPISCGYTKTLDGNTYIYTGQTESEIYNIDGKYNVFYRYQLHDGTYTQWYLLKDHSTQYKVYINSNTSMAGCEFVLSSANEYNLVSDDNIIDRELVPIIKDGKNGADGEAKNAQFYKLVPQVEKMQSYQEAQNNDIVGLCDIYFTYELHKVDGDLTTRVDDLTVANKFTVRYGFFSTGFSQPSSWTTIPSSIVSGHVVYSTSQTGVRVDSNHYIGAFVELINNVSNDLIDRRVVLINISTEAWVDVNASQGEVIISAKNAADNALSLVEYLGNNITSIVEQTIADDSTIKNLQVLVQQTATSLESKVSRSEYNAKTGLIDQQISTIQQDATSITQRVGNAETRLNNGNFVISANTTINGNLRLKGLLQQTSEYVYNTYIEDQVEYQIAPNETYVFGVHDTSDAEIDIQKSNIVVSPNRWSDIPDGLLGYTPVVILPSHDAIQVDTDKWTTPMSGLDGLQITITNPYNPKYSRWSLFRNDMESSSTSVYNSLGIGLLEHAVILCSDPRLISDRYHRNPDQVYSWVPVLNGNNELSTVQPREKMDGNFICAGSRGRLLILLPGQSVNLLLREASAIDENGDLFVYNYWLVMNSDEFVSIRMAFEEKKSTDSTFVSAGVNSAYNVGGGFAEDSQYFQSSIFGSIQAGASFIGEMTEWYPMLSFNYKDQDYNYSLAVTARKTLKY